MLRIAVLQAIARGGLDGTPHFLPHKKPLQIGVTHAHRRNDRV